MQVVKYGAVPAGVITELLDPRVCPDIALLPHLQGNRFLSN